MFEILEDESSDVTAPDIARVVELVRAEVELEEVEEEQEQQMQQGEDANAPEEVLEKKTSAGSGN